MYIDLTEEEITLINGLLRVPLKLMKYSDLIKKFPEPKQTLELAVRIIEKTGAALDII